MSGHNKWSKIKRGKEAKDKVRGNTFSKLSRLITLAVLEGGGITDPNNNIKLRLAIDKAKHFNMPKENIARAVARASGPDKSQIREIIYEGFAPAGVGLIIYATTDNPNRTLSEIRNILERHQGKLGTPGSVSYLFQRCGTISIDKNKMTEDKIYEFADKIKALDIEEDEQSFFIYFPYENLGKIHEYLNGLELPPAEIDYKPQTLIEIKDEDTYHRITALIEALENLDDVHRVFANYEKSS
jgi:YebC/PmpR family DNA-binding regulatory protein